MSEYSVIVCINRRYGPNAPSCAERGSEALADTLEQLLKEMKMEVEVKRIECLGQCERGPNLRIAPGGRFFSYLTAEDLPAVIIELQRLLQQE